MNIEEKMVFGISPGQGDGVPCVLLGIPAKAWEHMRDGKTHTFDLTKAGLPIKLILYGAADHKAAMKMIEGHLAATNTPYLNELQTDFSIKPLDSGDDQK